MLHITEPDLCLNMRQWWKSSEAWRVYKREFGEIGGLLLHDKRKVLEQCIDGKPQEESKRLTIMT